MITLATPAVAAFLAEPDAWPVLLDWLQEREAELADVLRLYAGTPPAYLDGLPLLGLCDWLLWRMQPPDRRFTSVNHLYVESYHLHLADPTILRDLKRAVLALFPEVVVDWVFMKGLVPCHVVYAPDLIPAEASRSEPRHVAGAPLRAGQVVIFHAEGRVIPVSPSGRGPFAPADPGH